MNRTTIAQHEAPDYIRDLKPFRASHLSAVKGRVTRTGDLPAEHREQYEADDVLYTVLSYETPIGWVTYDGTARMPSLRYSLTTTQHQHVCSRGLFDKTWYAVQDDDTKRAVPPNHYGPREGW